MKKIFSIAMLFCCFSAFVAKADVNAESATKMIKELTTEGIEQIINKEMPLDKKTNIFRELFTKNLDLDFIGKYVLGRYWKTASKSQQDEFIKLYKELNVQTWSKRFDEFKGKEFAFKGTTASNNKTQIFVDTEVPMEDAKPISVKWRVSEKKGKLKVIDIIIENVSLAQTARNEYSSFIAKSPNGVEGLLENLRQKIK